MVRCQLRYNDFTAIRSEENLYWLSIESDQRMGGSMNRSKVPAIIYMKTRILEAKLFAG